MEWMRIRDGHGGRPILHWDDDDATRNNQEPLQKGDINLKSRR